ncbi:CHAT domain-containing tetratricopeptide repeat protein [Nocardioides sp. C4-1]|uniref:CHAT domain-containing protein n=1 Tax=Nocardioides sp. C4-1 TaxID=3151851 RepID=UPI003266069E
MVDDLLELAMDDPSAATAAARRVIAARGDAAGVALAHRTLGVVLRDGHQVGLALRHLRRAVAVATATGDAALAADVRATLGMTLCVAGRERAGLAELDAAAAVAGDHRAMTLMRRAAALGLLGRHDDAGHDYGAAVDLFAAAGDRVWEARARHNLGWNALEAGRTDVARAETERARALFASAGLELDEAWARQNLGEVAEAEGDLPRALAIYDAVHERYDQLGHERTHLAIARAQALIRAGLHDDAVAVASSALGRPAFPQNVAWLHLVVAEAASAASDDDRAREHAREARRLFARLGNRQLELRARRALRRGAPWRAGALRVAAELHGSRSDLSPPALLLAASLAPHHRATLLADAATYRRSSRDLVRASGWLATALLHDEDGAPGRVLRACGRGLDALDEHRETLGSTELRALATTHGRDLATLALRHAVHHPRTLLRWSERWRATALAQPSVTPGDEPVLASLAALRDNGRRLAEARADGAPTDQLEGERARLERAVRAEHHRQSGTGPAGERFDVARLVAEVGDGCLVELVDVDDVLHVLVVHDGRVRRHVAGTTTAALALTRSAAFVLRRAARGRPFAPGDLGRLLQAELLGDAAGRLPDGPVTVVPTGRLHGVPWALLPALAGRPFAVVPSAAQWLRAHTVRAPTGAPLVLLAGPGLGTGGAEVPVLAGRRPGAVLLDGDRATVGAAMAALDGAALAHVAAHGRFRADSPLFSALELADGPLTVYDLERLDRAPHRVVLSACESGVLAPVGADELLGLASALFALGTAGLVCSVAEVNDDATAALMVDLHAHLDAGLEPAAALCRLRSGAGGVAAATAASFVAMGA